MTFTLTRSSVVAAREGRAGLTRQRTREQVRDLGLARVANVLIGTLIVAPLSFGAVEPWAWGGLALIACFLLLWWVAKCVRQSALRVAWSPLYLPGTLFLLLGAIQIASHQTLDAIGTREALIKLSSDLAFFFLATQCLAASRQLWHKLGLTITVFAFALALFGVIQFFSDPTRIYWAVKPRWPGWIFGPYVNHNHYAGLMEMLIPVGAAYAWTRGRMRPARWLAIAAVLIAAASVLLSGSRGGLVAMVVEACLFFGILLLTGATDRTRLARSAALGIAGAAVIFLWMDTAHVTGRLATIFDISGLHEAGWTSRKSVALDSLRILRDHPWVGTGLGSFEVAYPRYQRFPSDEVWDHAHNDFAEALAESGFVGGALIVAAMALFFRLAFADLGTRLRNPCAWLQFGAAVGLCGILVHSFCDFNLHIPANATWFAICAAWATCGPPYRDPPLQVDAQFVLSSRQQTVC